METAGRVVVQHDVGPDEKKTRQCYAHLLAPGQFADVEKPIPPSTSRPLPSNPLPSSSSNRCCASSYFSLISSIRSAGSAMAAASFGMEGDAIH